ncbi:hypothetical protein ACUOCP_30810, partial [Escherichia sp. R-CC3]
MGGHSLLAMKLAAQ